MAVPYTTTTDLANLVQTAYDRKVRLALRSVPTFRAIADTKPVQQTQPGSTVVFQIHQDLLPAVTPLNETTDPAGTSLGNTSQVFVTLQEYGTYTVVSKAVKEFALDADLDGNIANILAYNQAESIDIIVAGVLSQAPQVIVEAAGALVVGGDIDDIVATDTIKSRDITRAVADLRSASVMPFDGVNYVAYIHPRVARDLRAETDLAGWRTPNANTDSGYGNIIAGEIGTYEGVRFIETPRVPVQPNLGGTLVFTTFVLGREALAEAVAEEFHVVANGVVNDPLKRKMVLGWYGIAGWSLFRPQALWAIKTAVAN